MNDIIKYFTDGACSVAEGSGGFAFVKVVNDQKIKEFSQGEKNTTNNRMEIKAIISSLEDIKESYCNFNGSYNIEITSDSQYCINSITKWIFNWARNNWLRNTPGKNLKNDDLWEYFWNLKNQIYKLNKNIKITFSWVKGHDQNVYNNLADNLAVNARLNNTN